MSECASCGPTVQYFQQRVIDRGRQQERLEWQVVWIHLYKLEDVVVDGGVWRERRIVAHHRSIQVHVAVCRDQDGLRDARPRQRPPGDLFLDGDGRDDERRRRKAYQSRLRSFLLVETRRSTYLEAVSNPTFYQHVAHCLDMTRSTEVDDAVITWTHNIRNESKADDPSISHHLIEHNGIDPRGSHASDSKEHAVVLKFYLAGGSCRNMFGRSTDDVIDEFQTAMTSVPDQAAVVFTSGDQCNDQATNRFYGFTPEYEYCIRIISSWNEAADGSTVGAWDENGQCFRVVGWLPPPLRWRQCLRYKWNRLRDVSSLCWRWIHSYSPNLVSNVPCWSHRNLSVKRGPIS